MCLMSTTTFWFTSSVTRGVLILPGTPSKVPEVSNTSGTLPKGCYRPTVPILGRDQVTCQFNTDSVTPATMLLNVLDLGLYHTIIILVPLAVMTTLSNQLLGAILLAEMGDIRRCCHCRRCASVTAFVAGCSCRESVSVWHCLTNCPYKSFVFSAQYIV